MSSFTHVADGLTHSFRPVTVCNLNTCTKQDKSAGGSIRGDGTGRDGGVSEDGYLQDGGVGAPLAGLGVADHVVAGHLVLVETEAASLRAGATQA